MTAILKLREASRFLLTLLVTAGAFYPSTGLQRAEANPPAGAASFQAEMLKSNNQVRLRWKPFPATESYRVWSSAEAQGPYRLVENPTGKAFDFLIEPAVPWSFYRVEATPMSTSNALVSIVLNRLAYGPTPDELERVRRIGADAYIAEQLAPETIIEPLDQIPDPSTNGVEWVDVKVTGTATSSTLYLYLTRPGEVLIDNVRLVAGTNLAGANLLPNGDFELPLTNNWIVSTNASLSTTSEIAVSGSSSLRLVVSNRGDGKDYSVYQSNIPGVVSGQTYTLSYSYIPSTNGAPLVIRLSNATSTTGVYSEPERSFAAAYRRLRLGTATMNDLRAWYSVHAVEAKRQLLEVLTQFFENHFVTQYSKSRDYFDRYYNDQDKLGVLATDLEFREISRWREALLNPNCTFSNLLVISAESPAMIIYLDTVDSRGDGTRIANENYARELLELFTFGVDNGYDQNDIVAISKAWTGWSVNIVDATNIYNPLALRTTNLLPGAPNNNVSNLAGVWTFNYKSSTHNNSSKTVFPGKTIPARFGPPWAGKSYQLILPSRSGSNGGTNGIQDGYQVLAHLCNQPFTMEYISVKLCRLFVHDDFETGYDFTSPDLSPEGQLVKACMQAWDQSVPKGNIRAVLKTIFDSELFRSQDGALQKVKTPLEFTASAIRALRSEFEDGTVTARTDGYSLETPLSRMGAMSLFNRADPDGYPENGPSWISAGTLAERLRFVQALLTPLTDSRSDAGNSWADPVLLLKRKLPAAQWTNAEAVADYFLSILYPGEGRANLQQYREAAIEFLNTNDSQVNSPFRDLQPGGSTTQQTTYNLRVRSMVSFLMTLPRFQEQ
jgi:uncharacterized protein (DUF1800 family)